MKISSLLALPLLVSGSVVPKAAGAPVSVLQHSGSSPFDPRKEDDTRFVVDTGSGLDTGCTFRDGGPLVIHVPVKRFVGDDLAASVSRGLLSKKAHIRMPAFDVDVNGAPGFPPEVDRVSFNGHDLGTLTGDSNIWKLNEFNVPIDWMKFPSRGTSGAPSPADNVIRIDIDTRAGYRSRPAGSS